MGENRNRRNKRKSKNSLSNRMALIGITVVVASLAVVVHIGGASLRERDLEYQAREQALEKSLAKEEREPRNSRSTACMFRRSSILRRSRKRNWGL